MQRDCHSSSTAEQLFCKQQVVGSIPTNGFMKYIEMNKSVVDKMEARSSTPGNYPWKRRPDGSAVMEVADDVYTHIKNCKFPNETMSEAVLRLI
jgi:hypothetical protein